MSDTINEQGQIVLVDGHITILLIKISGRQGPLQGNQSLQLQNSLAENMIRRFQHDPWHQVTTS